MPRCRADIAALHQAVETVRRHRRMTAREVAIEVGVPPSTLTRIKDGHGLDVDAFASFLYWLGDDPMRFVKRDEEGPDEHSSAVDDKTLVSRDDAMVAYSWAREALAGLPDALQPSGGQRALVLAALDRLHEEVAGSPGPVGCDLGALQEVARLSGQ